MSINLIKFSIVKLVVLLTATGMLLIGTTAIANAAPLAYYLKGGTNEFGIVDLNSGLQTPIATLPNPGYASGFGVANGKLYITDNANNVYGHLSSIDPVTGQVSSIGSSGIYYTAFGSTSKGLFAYGSPGPGTLYSVNPTTGAATPLGTVGASGIGVLGSVATLSTSSDSDSLYGLGAYDAYAAFYSINTSSPGSAISFNDTNSAINYHTYYSMIVVNGTLYSILDIMGSGHNGYGSGNTINPATAVATPYGSYLSSGPEFFWLAPSLSTQSPPAAPSNLAAKAKSSTQIVLGWQDNSNNEAGFIIEKKIGGCSSTNSWNQIGTKPPDSTTHTVLGLSPNTTYSLRVKAYNAVSDSSYSTCVSAKTGASGTPPSSTNFKATSASSAKINLTWSDNATNETGFKIYRKAGSGASMLLTTTDSDVKNFSDTTATNNTITTIYQYYILAFNASGNSPVTYTATVPYSPTNLLAAQSATAGSIKLTWTDKSNNETGFEIWRKIGDCSSTSAWTKVTTLGANKISWTNTGLSSGSTYSYRIRAYKKTGSM